MGALHPQAGWPVGQYDPITPRGEAEQLDKLLFGLSRQKEWRQVAARLAAAVVLVVIVIVMVMGVIISSSNC